MQRILYHFGRLLLDSAVAKMTGERCGRKHFLGYRFCGIQTKSTWLQPPFLTGNNNAQTSLLRQSIKTTFCLLMLMAQEMYSDLSKGPRTILH